jgi:hypothetical protein
MNFQANSCQIRGRATVTTSGQIIEGLRGGGMRTSSMVSEFTSAQMQQVLSLGFGRWGSASSGLQMLRAT